MSKYLKAKNVRVEIKRKQVLRSLRTYIFFSNTTADATAVVSA